MPSAFALYRFPHADCYTRIEGETQEFRSCSQLDGVAGFVVAPFEVRDDQPIVVISPDVLIEERQQKTEVFASAGEPAGAAAADYAIDFANFHSQLCLGMFRKIVLARCAEENMQAAVAPEELFHRACQLYPRMFIALVNTPKSGCWLTATPEVLLENKGNSHWQTIALAGTMKLEGEQLSGEGESVNWTTKNIQEQRYVTTYIAECLEQFTGDFQEEGPYAVRAANLVHLRSDFNFTLPSADRIGDLLQTLHPTPAVCGLPKRDAFQFIIRNEHTPRRYYSGFMGPIGEASTHLYVSLRCMNIEDNHYHLYAGGGLLKDSMMEQEWQETEAKLETMRKCIATRNT